MAQQQQVELGSLNLEQLNMLKQQLEEEMQVLTSSLQSLKIAVARYLESKEFMKSLTTENKGIRSAFELSDVNNVLVDIGTGYYVKKSIKEANEYSDRKIKLINENADKVQQAIAVKRKNLESVLLVMQAKIEEIEAQEAASSSVAVKA